MKTGNVSWAGVQVGLLIKEAKKILGIRKAIPFEFQKAKYGTVSGKFFWDKIIIKVGPGAGLETMAYVVLHELVHFQQFLENRYAFPPKKFSKMKHNNRPWEAEANYWADKYTAMLVERMLRAGRMNLEKFLKQNREGE